MPFYPQNFEKWKNLLEISLFYTCVPKITIIWCMVPEIQSETGRIFCHFGPFFALSAPWQLGKSKFWKTEKNAWRYYHFTHVYHKWQSYDVWFLSIECNEQIFLSFWTIFCPFTPLTTQKIKILKKWKKHLEILSFYTCVTKIRIICYTVPEIWRMTDVIVIFHFGLFFALLPP